MSRTSLWAQFDAMIVHPGKLPSDCIHEEAVMTEEELIQISAEYKRTNSPGLCRAFIFATGGSVRGVYLAPQIGSPCDHLAVERLFPNGAISIKLLEVPGTSLKLINDWRVLVSSGKVPAPANVSVQSYFNVHWEGNIVLACYHRSAPHWPRMNHAPLALSPFIVLLLKSFLQIYVALDKAIENGEP
ncbi:hypothetical protein D9619_012394 [Psilocybe cf. subviscida]|uniref:Uncharacterized protein n=1 Tax=Psilocybe cf. subviscida TaxID=2480587 RepID=A0A8H5ARU5_9AGAR|nr:hypothetical protein D9619_012394 [Psilocybe cf. subviscida]